VVVLKLFSGVLMMAGMTMLHGVAKADDADLVKAGARAFAPCRACHTVDPDADSGLGPNLWGTYGGKSAHRDDFEYSPAMKKANIVWTEENLDKWLTSPKTFLPGSKMAYIGMAKAEDRKALIAFLKTKK
jgi:cytochrome c